MSEIVAYCGLACNECPAYQATQGNDNIARAKVAEIWTNEYKHPVKPEDINCDGCLAGGKRHVGYCAICEIRKCGTAKNVVNCGRCSEYPCDTLGKMLVQVPQAKARLDAINKSR
jgi:hypothetical protein